jgi:Transglutaminase-like superfamily
MPQGWLRVQAICDYVNRHIRFDYMLARSNRSASEAFGEAVGVCRDFTHLAIAFCRILIGRGRDAADVPLTTSFGLDTLTGFKVWTDEQPAVDTIP